jgi:multidrug resistance protein MdtO
MLKYRLRLPGFELPAQVQAIQVEYDDHQAAILEGMAGRLEGKTTLLENFGRSSEAVEDAAQECCRTEAGTDVGARLMTFVRLARHLDSLIQFLRQEI